MIDPTALRADFPVLAREVHGHPLAYLDNAATSQKPQVVLDALQTFYRSQCSNVHRGIHTLSEEATAAYERARETVAAFIGAGDTRGVVFTRNTTESINLVAHSWGRKNVGAGDTIVVTEMEHHSNLVPWQMLAEEVGAQLAFIPVTDGGRLDLSEMDRLLTGSVKLVAVSHASNVLGTVNPVRRIADAAHRVGAGVLLDAAQSAPHIPLCVTELDCDFLAFSGHKACGPTGVGVLYARPEILDGMDPFLTGGGMIRRVRRRSAEWADVPWRFEAGTMAIAEAIALERALRYLRDVGMESIQELERSLTRYAFEQLSSLNGVRLFGPPPEDRIGVLSFVVDGVHAHDVAHVLDRSGVAVRAGHHCAQPLHERFDVPATVRASVYLYNTREEIDRLIVGIERAIRLLGEG